MRYSKPPLGRAEQRSSVRIKTLALCLSEASLQVSRTLRVAQGTRRARTWLAFFWLLFLAKQKKVTRLPGRNPASPPERKNRSHPNTLSPHKGQRHKPLPLQGNHKGCPYDLTPHSYKGTALRALLRPHSSLLRPHSLTPHSCDPMLSRRTENDKPRWSQTLRRLRKPNGPCHQCGSTQSPAKLATRGSGLPIPAKGVTAACINQGVVAFKVFCGLVLATKRRYPSHQD